MHVQQKPNAMFASASDHSHIYSCKQVVDEDYRGNVGVILFNFSDKDFEGA